MKNQLHGAVDALVAAQTKELRLPTVGTRFAELADQAAADGTPHRDYLAHLLELELDARAEREPSVGSSMPTSLTASVWRTSSSRSRRSTPPSCISWPKASTSNTARTSS